MRNTTERGSRRWARAALRLLRSPIATAVFAVLLYVSMPRDAGFSLTQRRAGMPVHPGGAPDLCFASVVRTAQGLRVVAPDQAQSAGTPVGVAWYAYRQRMGGDSMSLVTREAQTVGVSGGLTHAECDEVVRLYVGYLEQHPHEFWRKVGAELKAAGTDSIVKVSSGVPWSKLWNGLLVMMLLHSLWWLPGAVGWVQGRIARLAQPPLTPQEKRWRSLARGECPTCAYSIEGLSQHQCPECGERWNVMELTAWSRRR